MEGAKFTFELIDRTTGGTRAPDMAHGPPGQPILTAPPLPVPPAGAGGPIPPAGLGNDDPGDGTGKGSRDGGFSKTFSAGLQAITNVADKAGLGAAVSPMAGVLGQIGTIAASGVTMAGAVTLAGAGLAASAGLTAAAINNAASRAEQLASLNGTLAAAKAQEDLKNLRFDIASANQNAPAFAAGLRLRNELGRGTQGIWDSLSGWIAERVDAASRPEDRGADWQEMLRVFLGDAGPILRNIRDRGRIGEDPDDIFTWWANQEHLPIPSPLLEGAREGGAPADPDFADMPALGLPLR